MQETSANNKRIAKNTMFLYFRMLLTLVVGLYTSRVVLQTLGISDYGLYNVVGGIITLFTFINSTLASGTQRFMSFALGEQNFDKMKSVFSTAIYLHALFSLIIVVIAELVGLWLLYNKMQIPDGRMDAAFWVFQFSIFATMVKMMEVPFMATLIAHEKMSIYAYISIYDVVMKLIIVYLIQIVDYDKLIFYAFLLFVVHVSSALMYLFYCRAQYREARSIVGFDKSTFKELSAFSGWNIFGCGAVALQGQGVNILLNMFFGTVVNAARGIAFQVNGIILQFVNNFQVAVNPQIVKLYASGQKEEMIKLVLNNSKFAAFLFLIIAIPAFVEIEFVLRIWLGEYPDYAPIFLRIIIVQSLIQTMTRPVVMAIHAVGKMKAVNLTSGSALLLILPISYLLLKLGCSPVTIFLVNVIPWLFEVFFELFWLKKYIDFPMSMFYIKVYGIVFPIALLIVAVPLVLHIYLPFDGWIRFLIVCIISVVTSVIAIYYLGLSKHMREVVSDKMKSFVMSKLNKK